LWITHFDLVDILAVLLFQLGIGDGRPRMSGQRRGVELLEGDDSTSVAQAQGFVGAKIAGMGEAGGQTDDRGNGLGSQGFLGCLRIFLCSYGGLLSGINLTETELPSLPL
jgi:hypothetical protein